MSVRYGKINYTIRKTRGRSTWEVRVAGVVVQDALSELGAYAWARLDGEYRV